MGKNKESESGEVTRIIEEYFSLGSPGSSRVLEGLCHHEPQLLERVRSELAAVKRMDGLLQSAAQSTQREQATPPGAPNVSLELGKKTGVAIASAHYLIQRFHARGGCSEVYVAEDSALGRTVAIKFLRPDQENRKSLQARLRREAEITSRLDHPGIVSIHARGTDSRGFPFYVMRFVEGQSFRSVIMDYHRGIGASNGPGLRVLIDHFIDVCQTVAFAHSRGVIHRDIKPENIVTGNFGETYLVDWGLSKRIHDSEIDSAFDECDTDCDASLAALNDSTDSENQAELTDAGSLVGTPAYLSPEQANGHAVGEASDIFNLGATLYSILTGTAPYNGSSLIEIVENARHVQCRPILELAPRISRPLVAICNKAMAKRIEDRYQSASELADDLNRFIADEPTTAMRDSLATRTRRWIKKHRTLVTSLVSAGIVAILILGVTIRMLLNVNHDLTTRESEAVQLKDQATASLAIAEENLYSNLIALADSELKKNNVVRAMALLERCPVEYRSWEWHLLVSTIKEHQPDAVLSVQGRTVRGLAFCESTNRLAIGDSEGAISLFETNALDPQSFWPCVGVLEDGMEILDVSISPNGRWLIVIGAEMHDGRRRGAMHLWDMESQEIVRKRWGHGRAVHCVCWSEDGSRIVTGGNLGGIRIRIPQTLEPVARINAAHDGKVRAIRFDGVSNSEVISAGADGFLKEWDPEGTLSSSIQKHRDGITALVLTFDDMFTAGNDQLIRRASVGKTEGGSEDLMFVGHRDNVETIDVSNDGKWLASGGLDRNIRIWDATQGELTRTIRSHTSHIRRLAFSPDGRFLVTGGDDGDAKIWDTMKWDQRLPGGEHVRFLPGSDRFVSVLPNQLSIWDAEKQKGILREPPAESLFGNIAVANHSEMFSCLHHDGKISIFHTGEDGKRTILHENRSASFCGVFSSDDSRFISGHVDGTIQCWDPNSSRLVESASCKQRITGVALSADESTLVTTSWYDGEIVFWDFPSLKKRFSVAAHSRQILSVVADPRKQRIATTGHDGQVKIWDAETGKLLETISFGASWLNCLAFTPDGKRLVTGSEHTIVFWDTDTNQEVLSMSVEKCVHSISFSSDGKFMAVAGEDPRVRVWHVGQ